MKYPKAGDLQAQMGVRLNPKNPPRFVVFNEQNRAVFRDSTSSDFDQALDLFSIWINQDAPLSIRRDDEDPSVVDEGGGLTLHFRKSPRATYRIAEFENNPEICAEDADAAVDKFKEFHRFDPARLEELDGLVIPSRVRKLGAARYVLYRSAKVDPATLKKPKRPVDYIHEHDAGVTVYVTDGTADTDVPKHIRETTAIVKLGKCLGFALRDGHEAEGTAPLPDLACTPDGKCLLIIQDRRKVLAMFWGGALGVFARGIDG